MSLNASCGASSMPGTDPTVTNIFSRWLDWIAHGKRLSKHTVRAYEIDVTDFFDFMNRHRGATVTIPMLADCSLSDFRAWVAAKAANNITATSRARAVSSLRHFYRWLDIEGVLHNSYIKLLRNPKLHRTLPRPLSIDAAQNVLQSTEDMHHDWTGLRDRALFTLLYGAGLRIDEALRLNCKDWPKSADVFTITGKGNKQRQIVILDIIAQNMKLYRDACPFDETPERPIFIGKQGKRLNQGVAQRSIREIRALLNLPDTVTPHALRHSFATHLLQDGVNIRAIQELLGHASLSSTQRYTELKLDDLRSTITAFHPRASADEDQAEDSPSSAHQP
jgi:integrase/recombinase XerC